MGDGLDHLREWIGKRRSASDVVTAAPIVAMAATLDRDDPPPRDGDPLPPGWHRLYFLPRERQSALGPDGHEARGGFLPPVPLPRRMLAGARFTFYRPIRVGERIRRDSEVADIQVKQGRSGELVFVTVRHRISGPEGLAVAEDYDIVYRGSPSPGVAPEAPPPPGEPVWRRRIHPDPVLLFRFSALTFNGHRIHYDYQYAREVEGYPGLVVPGLLTAILLLDLLRRARPEARLADVRFRARRPLFAGADFTIAGEPDPEGRSCRLWALDPEGALAMSATAEFAA